MKGQRGILRTRKVLNVQIRISTTVKQIKCSFTNFPMKVQILGDPRRIMEYKKTAKHEQVNADIVILLMY